MGLGAAKGSEAQGEHVSQKNNAPHPFRAGTAAAPGGGRKLNVFRFQSEGGGFQGRASKATNPKPLNLPKKNGCRG
ncbi:hypothetical protein GCM10022408_14020 [Hymenobacter fastidiosus]|uniref:Uncharacterized protein n=1 Tax=Hymenobacter fastidiosus TaxID=486264 RepID=A0ABP7RXF5_9BACT